MEYQKQLQHIKDGSGFIAALDQSGGSTPKALANYGIESDAYDSDEAMFALVHEMRARIMTCECFDSERVLGAILFEDTMERNVNGKPSADYLWQEKNIVPFLKVDKGLAEQMSGVQVMRPMPNLDTLLDKAKTTPSLVLKCARLSMSRMLMALNWWCSSSLTWQNKSSAKA